MNDNIISCEDFHDCKNIKYEVIMAFNRVMSKNNPDNVDDSTSSITTKKIHFRDTPKIEFSMDVCIVTIESDKQWLRLIHEKGRNSYYEKCQSKFIFDWHLFLFYKPISKII